MPEKTYSISYNGYWRKLNQESIPDQPGIYSVYACRYDESKDMIIIRRLIYIGEAEDVRDRIKNHKKWDAWEKRIDQGEHICFNFALWLDSDRDRLKAALVYAHKPPENTKYRDNFPFSTTTVKTGGQNAFMQKSVTVRGTS